MKFISLCCCLLFALAASSQKSFDLTGSLPGKNNIKVELLRDPYGATVVLGSDTVRNGSFHIVCPVDEISLVSIAIHEGKMRSTYNIVLEPAKVTFKMMEDKHTEIDGGKYNQEILGYQKQPAFKKADAAFRSLTSGGNIGSLKGTDKEWDAIQLFVEKDAAMSGYLLDKMNNSKDPRTKVMAAIMLSLQPDAEKAMQIVDKAAVQLGEKSHSITAARELKRQQDEMIKHRKDYMTGQQYINFKAATIAGDSIALRNVVEVNKYTLVQFWASWCIPCRKEIPLLKKLYTNYHSNGFAIMSFSLDDNKNNWAKASQMENMNWTNVSDLKALGGAVARAYNISSIPANLLIDQHGNIVASNLTGDDLENKVKQLMQ